MIVIMENTHIKMRGKEREERNFGPHELCIFDLQLCVDNSKTFMAFITTANTSWFCYTYAHFCLKRHFTAILHDMNKFMVIT